LLVYIEKEIAKDFTTEMIMDKFYTMKDRRALITIRKRYKVLFLIYLFIYYFLYMSIAN